MRGIKYPTIAWRLRRCAATRRCRRLQPSTAFTYYRQVFASKHREATQIKTWKRQAIDGLTGVFSDKATRAEDNEDNVKELHAKVGKLVVDNDFCHKG